MSWVCPQRPGAYGGPCSREAEGPGACGGVGVAFRPGGAGAELQSPGGSRQAQGPVSGGPGGILRLLVTLGH